jgi:hypothetical protein
MYRTEVHVEADGTIRLRVPELAGRDVTVSVEPLAPKMTQAEWAAFIDRMAGAFPDFPDIERPGPETYRQHGDWA